MKPFVLLFALSIVISSKLMSQETKPTGPTTRERNSELLRQFNGALQALVARVSPAVVQVQAAGLAPIERG